VGYDFDAHVPSIIPLQPFPNDYGLNRPSCGQIREPQTLLQFEFLRAHKQTAVRAHYSSETWFRVERPGVSTPFDCHRDPRIHTRSAPSGARSYISRKIFSVTHRGWVPAGQNETRESNPTFRDVSAPYFMLENRQNRVNGTG